MRELDGGLYLRPPGAGEAAAVQGRGTSYEHFVHNMVEVEVEYTLRYMDVLRRLGREVPELSQSLCHIIASGMFNGLFEIVVHDMPKEQALRDVEQFRTFYTVDG